MITAHTDVVGSLLRPVALRKAWYDWMAGRLSHAQFKSIEDRAVDEAVSLQEAAGLDIVTDGEMRRLSTSGGGGVTKKETPPESGRGLRPSKFVLPRTTSGWRCTPSGGRRGLHC
jgi:hypothetical protein